MLKRVQHDTRGQAGSKRGLRACGHAAFTMAEILLSLTIIGVVAAITLPSLTGNINERTWNTQRKALYARFSQAIALMPALNGYGTLTEGDSSTSAVDTAAETFVTEGLSKVLKINNICDNTHLADCGIPSGFTNMTGSKIEAFPVKVSELNSTFVNFSVSYSFGDHYSHSQIDTKAVAFETQNGESIAVFYNPYCSANNNITHAQMSQDKMCANFIYDLNGNKGPNTVGKDIGFITALYATDTNVVAPLPLMRQAGAADQPSAGASCMRLDAESRVPNIEELEAMFYNTLLIGGSTNWDFWSSSMISATAGWYMHFPSGAILSAPRKNSAYAVKDVRCIKR